MRPQFPDDKTDLGAMRSYCSAMRKIYTDRFEVVRIKDGYTVVQDLPDDGPIIVDGVKQEIA